MSNSLEVYNFAQQLLAAPMETLAPWLDTPAEMPEAMLRAVFARRQLFVRLTRPAPWDVSCKLDRFLSLLSCSLFQNMDFWIQREQKWYLVRLPANAEDCLKFITMEHTETMPPARKKPKTGPVATPGFRRSPAPKPTEKVIFVPSSMALAALGLNAVDSLFKRDDWTRVPRSLWAQLAAYDLATREKPDEKVAATYSAMLDGYVDDAIPDPRTTVQVAPSMLPPCVLSIHNKHKPLTKHEEILYVTVLGGALGLTEQAILDTMHDRIFANTKADRIDAEWDRLVKVVRSAAPLLCADVRRLGLCPVEDIEDCSTHCGCIVSSPGAFAFAQKTRGVSLKARKN
jgi:hypothetical protein